MSQLLSQTHRVNRGRGRPALGNGKTDVSIIASEPPAVGTAGPIDSARSALIPAAVFIIVEIILVAEAISVILLKEIDLRNPAATPIAILLSLALLANLGIVCSMAAASAANSIRKPEYWEPSWSVVVESPPSMPGSAAQPAATHCAPPWPVMDRDAR
jgi:hypothetical protein